MSTRGSCDFSSGSQAVGSSLDTLSKSARRKFKRYGKIPTELRSQSPEMKRWTRSEIFDFGLQIQSGTQQQVWEKLEIMKRQPKKLNLFAGKGQHSKMKEVRL
jgi:hypothetical protein